MAIFESPADCLPGYLEHSIVGHIIKSDGVRIQEYYCPRCNQIIKVERTGQDA